MASKRFKARLEQLLDAALNEGSQIVTRRGIAAAVLVSIQDWERRQHSAGISLKALLLSDEGRTGDLIPQRGTFRRRCNPEVTRSWAESQNKKPG